MSTISRLSPFLVFLKCGYISYLALYSGLTAFAFVAWAVAAATWVLGTVWAGRRLHRLLVESVLGATLRQVGSFSKH